MEILNSSLNFLTKKFNNHLDSMRKDSILQNYYYSKLPKAEVGQQTGDPNKPYSKTNPQGYVSMKNNKDWFDNHANWTSTGNQKWDAKVRQQVMTGRFGVDPNSGALIKLPQSEWTNVSEEDKRLATDKRQWTAAQKQKSWENQVKPQIVKSTKDLITNPVMMAPGAILTGGMAAGIPAISRTAAAIAPALETSIGGVPGLTASNLINAGFAYHGAKNIPKVVNSWQDVINNPTWGNISNAAGETAITGLDMLPFVHGASKGISSVMQDANQVGNYLTTQTPLKDTYKINPWAFKPNPEAYYHRSPNLQNIVNQETGMLQGFGQSEAGQAYSELAKPGMGNTLLSDGRVSRLNLRKPANSEMYFSKGVPLDWGRYNPETLNQAGKRIMTGQGYPGPYIAEVTDVPFVAKANGKYSKVFDPNTGEYVRGVLPPTNIESYAVSKRPISLDEANFYTEDWLRGYKKVPKPTTVNSSKINTANSEDFFKNTNVVPANSTAEEIDPYQKYLTDYSNYNKKNGAKSFEQLAEDADNTIITQGHKIMEDLRSPEGMSRLKQQFRRADPNLTEEQLDYMVMNRTREVNTALRKNKAGFYLDHGRGDPNTPSFQKEANFFPIENAHYSGNYNPYYDVNSESAPLSLFGSESPTGPYLIRDNEFLNPEYNPGTVTLGRGREFNLDTVEHEARGHGLQGAGKTAHLPLEQDLLDLVKPKSKLDKWWYNKQIKSSPRFKSDYDYFNNGIEAYPFLVQNRQKMIEQGLLADTYSQVKPSTISKNVKINNGVIDSGGRFTSLYPWWKRAKLAKIMNTAPALVTGVAGAGLANQALSEKAYGGPMVNYMAGRMNHGEMFDDGGLTGPGPISFLPEQDPEMMYTDRFNTSLNKRQTKRFNNWAAEESKRQGRDILMDKGAYDVQGFWKSGDYKNTDENGHGSDKWKKPNHPTFSNQSKYHGVDGFYGGNWTPTSGFQPSKQLADMYGPSYYNRIFAEEPGRREHLDASRFMSGVNKPSPLYYKQGGVASNKGYYNVGMGVPRFNQGGDPAIAQLPQAGNPLLKYYQAKLDGVTHYDEGGYIVQKGDTLNEISKKTGVPLNTLVADNHISNPNMIHVNQKLIITGVPQVSQPIQQQQEQQPVIPEERGNWSNIETPAIQYPYQGETILRDKKIGTIETPVKGLNLRPVYKNFKKTVQEVYDPGCDSETGVGCSYQATRNAQKITGLPLVSYAPSDAGYRDAVAKRTGLQSIFDQTGEQQKKANSRAAGWRFPTSEDFKTWRAGDIVTLDSGNDSEANFDYEAPPGFSKEDRTETTHNGVILGFTPEGRPIIQHGYAYGKKNKGRLVTEVLGADNRVTNLRHGRYAVKSVWRPKEIGADNQINTVRNVFDKAEEQAGRKAESETPVEFSLNNTYEEKLKNDLPVAAAFSGADTRLDTKNSLVNMFNNKDLDKELQYKLGITASELQNLKPVVFGIAGQETNFNDVDNPGAASKDIPGNMTNTSNSKGVFQIKFDSLTDDEKRVLDIKTPNDLLDDKKAYKAAILLMYHAKNRMDKEVEQGTHPGLKSADPYFRAAYYYNSPARAISTADEWAKGSNDASLFNPTTWLNPFTTREQPSIFSDARPNYVEQIQLRMDKGSYPYKLMEKSKDLNMDFKTIGEDASSSQTLEPIVIRSFSKKSKSTFKPKGKK